MKRLDEIEARANAATEGPWRVAEADQDTLAVTTRGRPPEMGLAFLGLRDEPDAEFIAHAREDVPRLVDALRAVLEVHQPIPATITSNYRGTRDVTLCAHCFGSDDYPCPTVTAITRALEGETRA